MMSKKRYSPGLELEETVLADCSALVVYKYGLFPDGLPDILQQADQPISITAK